MSHEEYDEARREVFSRLEHFCLQKQFDVIDALTAAKDSWKKAPDNE